MTSLHLHAKEVGFRLLLFLLILSAVLVYHWRGLQPGYTFIPVDLGQSLVPWFVDHPDIKIYNPVVGDSLYEHYPFLTFVVRELSAGRLPLWDPTIFMGHPAFADPIYQAFYPVWSLIALGVGNVARGFALGTGFHVLIAACLTYALSRTLGHTRAAALVAAFTYAFGGFMVTWLEMLIWPATLTWLPGVLLCYERSVRGGSFGWLVLAAVAYALSWLGGQIQAALFFSFVWGIYALGRTIEQRITLQKWQFFPLLSFLLAAGVGVLLAMPLLLSFAEFLELSRRAVTQGLYDPLPPIQLITLLIPDYFGNPQRGAYWGMFNYSEFTIYTGVVALSLAIAAPFASRRFYTYFLTVMTIGTIYVAVGGPGVTILKEIPIIKYLNLARMVYILPLYVALLAAEVMSQPRLPRWSIPLASGIILTVVGILMWNNTGDIRQHLEILQPDLLRLVLLFVVMNGVFLVVSLRTRWQPLWQWVVVCLVFIDLYLWGALYNPAGRIDELVPITPSIEFLQSEDSYRTVAIQYDGFVFGHNLLSLFEISQPGGYSSIMFRPVYEVIAAGDPQNGFGTPRDSNWQLFTQPSPRLLELLQATQLASLYPIELDDDDPKPALLDDSWGDEEIPPLFLYEQKTPLPRAFVVYDSEVINDQSMAVARVLVEEFPIESKVIVAESLPIVNQSLPATPATILSYTPQRVEIDVQATDSGLLVLGDVNYPGWRATVDGTPAEVVTANVVWRGVVVPAGNHRVVFTFEPSPLRWGFTLAAMAGVSMILLMIVDRWRQRSAPV